MRVSDQPGRVLAVLIVAPLLAHVSWKLGAVHKDDLLARLVGVLAVSLFVYESFWLACWPPKRVTLGL